MPRGIDHLVLAVRDLDEGAALYERLGFTLTPPAQHPFGTGNRLAQLSNGFLELLSVTRPEDIIEADEGGFSFGAYNRDFLAHRQGVSMISLTSDDWQADRKSFDKKKLKPYAPFAFERQAKRPDGSEVTVGFDLTFVTHPDMPEAPFFTCCHRHERDVFYKPEFQVHDNGAHTLISAIILAPDPVKTRKFIEDLGCDEEQMPVNTPEGFLELFPEVAQPPEDRGTLFVGYWIGVDNLDRVRALLEGRGVPFTDFPGCLEIAPETAFGALICFAETEA